MAKHKKVIKAKEPIKVRFKSLANGNKSIYLDMYNPEGDKNHLHKYEFLKGMYIVPEVDEASKVANANTLLAVNAIKAQRVLELTNEKAGIKKSKSRGRMLLKDWMLHYAKIKVQQGQSKSNAVSINNTLLHLEAFCKGKSKMLKDIDKNFCEGFVLYLSKATAFKGNLHVKNKPLAKSTANLYLNTFTCALNEAVRDEIIEINPMTKLKKEDKKPVRGKGKTRTYLTIEEVKMLASTECNNPEVKRAFLFACFCGLRISDIVAMKWKHLRVDNGQLLYDNTMIKTKEALLLPINKAAQSWMPEQGTEKKDDAVFHLPTNTTINSDLKVWAKQAGITKDICFHVSRHTFATGLLTLGADLYTTSKLLGHQNIRTTQVYAEIVNSKKVDAVNLYNNILD